MKKKLIVVSLVLLLTFALATPVFAASPCNDTNGDGSPSGYEYATYHIVPLATAGMLGAGGHIPGEHHGFSLCDPSGK
jgi:hypothetical protein